MKRGLRTQYKTEYCPAKNRCGAIRPQITEAEKKISGLRPVESVSRDLYGLSEELLT